MDGLVYETVTREHEPCAPVPLLVTLLATFHQRKISYCYWKSSRRVREALAGESDLDLIIARSDRDRAQQILLELGFKLFPAIAHRDNPAVASFLGYDETSGLILHLHLHFRLVIGGKLLKDIRLPWEETILARAAAHPSLPIRVLDPASEALLAVVRACIELRPTDLVALRHRNAMRRKFEMDREQLVGQLDPSTLCRRAREVFSDDLAALVVDAFFSNQPLGGGGTLRRRLLKQLAAWRTYNEAESWLRSGARTVLWAAGGFNDRVLRAPRPWRRRAPGGGCVAALLGVDGSGKTTVGAEIRSWLSSEVDVIPIYFGTGEGRPSLLLLPFKLMVPLVAPLFRTKPKGASHGKISDRPPGFLYSASMMVWATIVAMEKRGKLLAARRGAERGLLILTDRYPQDEDLGYNDGPLLGRVSLAPRWLRRFEARAYGLARKLPPDLVIKLDVTPETAARREPNMDPAVIGQRIEAARRMRFPGSRVVRVDAEQPLADVLRAVKREVWCML